MQNFDLASFDLTSSGDAGVPVVIEHPVTGQPLGITIHVLSADYPRVREKQRELLRRRVKKQRFDDPEEIERNSLELLAEATTAWSGVTWQGQDLAFTKANARMLYERLPFLRRAIENAVGDLKRFLTVSSPSVSSTPSTSGASESGQPAAS